jgi:nitronate monooxygenase
MDLPALQIGQHRARYPIIQGGMGLRISGANLAAAVANAGGIGIISAVGLGFNSPYFNEREPNAKKRRESFFEANRLALIDELRLARSLSPTGVIGINMMMAARDHATLIRTAAEQGANLVIVGAGLPLQVPDYTADHPEVALVPIVSTTRAAKIICRKWERQYNRLPDAFVVESPSTAGGHLGAKLEELESPDLAPEQVIPELVTYLRQELGAIIPVIAAGGVWDREDIERRLALGASGVQMATRFITTHECDADSRYKQFHLQAQPEDVEIVPSPVGMPGRALHNPFAERAIAQFPQPPVRCLDCLEVCKFRDRRETYCIFQALDRAARGDVQEGLIFAGRNAGRAERLISVAELMAELTCSLPSYAGSAI